MYKITYLDGTVKEFESLILADLSRANLIEADLSGAYLRGADLREANLSGADLRGAYLSGADLSHVTDIISFTLGKHFGFYHISKDYLKIGCEGMSLDEWASQYEQIGKSEGYSDVQIKLYGKQIKLIQELKQEGF